MTQQVTIPTDPKHCHLQGTYMSSLCHVFWTSVVETWFIPVPNLEKFWSWIQTVGTVFISFNNFFMLEAALFFRKLTCPFWIFDLFDFYVRSGSNPGPEWEFIPAPVPLNQQFSGSGSITLLWTSASSYLRRSFSLSHPASLFCRAAAGAGQPGPELWRPLLIKSGEICQEKVIIVL